MYIVSNITVCSYATTWLWPIVFIWYTQYASRGIAT